MEIFSGTRSIEDLNQTARKHLVETVDGGYAIAGTHTLVTHSTSTMRG